jgi:hypothetical protein
MLLTRSGFLNKLQKSGESGSMAIKTLAVLERRGTQNSHRGTYVGCASVRVDNPAIQQRFLRKAEDINQFELDNYRGSRWSLFQNGHNRAGGNPQQDGRMDRLFLLLLTWRHAQRNKPSHDLEIQKNIEAVCSPLSFWAAGRARKHAQRNKPSHDLEIHHQPPRD